MKGLNRTKCRIVRRLFLFFATLSVIPFTVLYLVTSDHLYRFRAYNYGTGTNGSRHQIQFHAVHHPPPAVVHHPQQQYRKHQQTTHDQQLQHKAIKNSTSNQYLIDMDYMKHRMEERVTRLNDKCNEYRLSEPKQNYKPKAWEYLINREYHLVWCNVFKAASTSWMYNFNLLAGYTPEFLKKTKDVPLQLARQRYPRPSVDASILQIAEDETYDSLRLINAELNRIFGRPDSMFLRTTPREFLFEGVPFCVNVIGIAKAICKEIEKRNTKTIRVQPDGSMKFSFFNHKNMTDDGTYTINTGIKEPSQTQMIEYWNGRSTLDRWINQSAGSSSKCNKIVGTDGSGYPPFREGVERMTIFSSDICRTVDIKYVGPSSYEGIPALRYETDSHFLNEIGPEYGNDCYCVNRIPKAIVKSNGCLYKGALDLSTCFDAPVVLTHPHMMGAAQEYTSLIDGLHPDPEKHQIFVDVEPLTGTPLNGGKRVQFNMFLRRIDSIRLTDRLQTTLFPVLWIEEGIALNEDMVKLIDDSLMKVLTLLDIIQWVMIGSGLLLAIIMPIVYFSKRRPSSGSITPTLTTTTSTVSISDGGGLGGNPQK